MLRGTIGHVRSVVDTTEYDLNSLPAVIRGAIDGGSGSGKTTFTLSIINHLMTREFCPVKRWIIWVGPNGDNLAAYGKLNDLVYIRRWDEKEHDLILDELEAEAAEGRTYRFGMVYDDIHSKWKKGFCPPTIARAAQESRHWDQTCIWVSKDASVGIPKDICASLTHYFQMQSNGKQYTWVKDSIRNIAPGGGPTSKHIELFETLLPRKFIAVCMDLDHNQMYMYQTVPDMVFDKRAMDKSMRKYHRLRYNRNYNNDRNRMRERFGMIRE
jgi:hypothetical protein